MTFILCTIICLNLSYADLIRRACEGNPRFFQELENHTPVRKRFRPKITDIQIHALYESLLAKSIFENQELNIEIMNILEPRIKEIMDRDIEKAAILGAAWDKRSILPGLNIHPTDKTTPYHYLDFLLFISYKNTHAQQDGLLDPELVHARDHFNNFSLGEARGDRIHSEPKKCWSNNQFGLIPQLKVDALQTPHSWIPSGCNLVKALSKNSYYWSAKQKSLPIVCGISGSTSLLLWTLATTHRPITTEDMRLLLVSIFTALALDGGHTLQEVLSSARLNVMHIKKLPTKLLIVKNKIDKQFIEALDQATQYVSPTGASPRHFANYWSGFFSFIKNQAFLDARKHAQEEFMRIIKNYCPKDRPDNIPEHSVFVPTPQNILSQQ